MLLEVKNMIKRYDHALALDHISFEVNEGELFGLLGPNGAGKTTMMSVLSGLIRPDDGEIYFAGQKKSTVDSLMKSQIGVVPQEIALFEDLSAEENLDYFGRLYGLRGKGLKENIHRALDFTGLSDRRKDYPKGFSGGMKRRLNIACAIVHQPRLILMDEPTVGIDPQSRNHILESIKALNREGVTIIYTSHYMEEVEQLCNRLAIVDHGRVIAQGTQEEMTKLVAATDKVTMQLDSVSYTLSEAFRRLGYVEEYNSEGNTITLLCSKGQYHVHELIRAIEEAQSELISFTVEKPTLESVFLTLTGRSLRD